MYMKVVKILVGFLFCLVSTLFFLSVEIATAQDSSYEWRAGTSSVKITPEEPTWMSGYSNRNRPSQGVIHDIWAKALAIEDIEGNKAILIMAEIRNFPKNISDIIRNQIHNAFGLTRDQIILNGTHTHTGPLMYSDMNYPYYISKLDEKQRQVVMRYSERFIEQIVTIAGDALESMEPAFIYAENGVARFAVNRRNNPSWQNPTAKVALNELTEIAGPSDHSVPVLKVTNTSGELISIVFGYACHPTTLGSDEYRISGDYVGFAQIELEKNHPESTALFFQGAAGDQDPMPRYSVAYAEQYGKTLAAAVEQVLNEDMRPLESRLFTAYNEVDLPLKTPPTVNELKEMTNQYEGNRKRWASWQLEKLQRGESLITSYPYPIQIWKVGEQPIFSFGGEVVVDYAIELKRIFGHDIFVMGFSNDVMSYIPSARILREGGYEGESSQWVRGMPSLWKTEIETIIMQEALKLADEVGVDTW